MIFLVWVKTIFYHLICFYFGIVIYLNHRSRLDRTNFSRIIRSLFVVLCGSRLVRRVKSRVFRGFGVKGSGIRLGMMVGGGKWMLNWAGNCLLFCCVRRECVSLR